LSRPRQRHPATFYYIRTIRVYCINLHITIRYLLISSDVCYKNLIIPLLHPWFSPPRQREPTSQIHSLTTQIQSLTASSPLQAGLSLTGSSLTQLFQTDQAMDTTRCASYDVDGRHSCGFWLQTLPVVDSSYSGGGWRDQCWLNISIYILSCSTYYVQRVLKIALQWLLV
jgi:hypothetical protein